MWSVRWFEEPDNSVRFGDGLPIEEKMKLKNDTQPITNVLGKDCLDRYLVEYLPIYSMIRPNKLVFINKSLENN